MLLADGLRFDRVELRLDYGQKSKAQVQEASLAAADLQIQELNSVVAALNYMTSQEWEFVTVSEMTRAGGGIGGATTISGYLLRRKP